MRHGVRERLIHVVWHTVQRKRLTIHCPWARAVRTGRAVWHEGLRRVRKCFAIVSNVRESGPTLHCDVVRMAHRRDMLAMSGLRHMIPGVVVVARVLVIRLLVVVDIVGKQTLFRQVRLVELVEKRATRARRLRVRLVVLLCVVPHLSCGLDSVWLGNDAVLFAGVVDYWVDCDVERLLEVWRSVVDVV